MIPEYKTPAAAYLYAGTRRFEYFNNDFRLALSRLRQSCQEGLKIHGFGSEGEGDRDIPAPLCQDYSFDVAGIADGGLSMMTSTRRFCCRPLEVRLSAIG